MSNLKIFTGRNEVVAKVMFLHVSIILLTVVVSGQGEPPRQGEPPSREEPPSGNRETTGQGEPPPDQVPPPGPCRPPREAEPRIRSASGWYASYVNAFLFFKQLDELFRGPRFTAATHRFLGQDMEEQFIP